MSLTVTPNFGAYVLRIVDILKRSALLFPKSVGGNDDVFDLVQQVIPFEIPIPENPPQGGSPHIFVTTAPNPVDQRIQRGRDDRNVQGPEELVLAFYIIVVVQGTSLEVSEEKMYNILEAITTTLDKDKRLTDKDGNNPLSSTSQWLVVPYLLNSDQRDIIARNVFFRPRVYVNLRSPA